MSRSTAILLGLLLLAAAILFLLHRPSPLPNPHWRPPPRSKTAHCRAHDGLPDAACTPGALFPSATAGQICIPGYARSVRNVPVRERNAVFAEYDIAAHPPGAYEVDHHISLELGGTNDIANLWPEPAADPSPGFHEKDTVENLLHTQVCAGKMSLNEAQREIATDWLQVLQH